MNYELFEVDVGVHKKASQTKGIGDPMLNKLAPYRKCIIAGIGALFTWGAKCSPDGFTAEEVWQTVGATVVATATVYLFPNGQKE